MSLLESMLLSFIANPSQNWTFQRFASVAEKERTQRKKKYIGYIYIGYTVSRIYRQSMCGPLIPMI